MTGLLDFVPNFLAAIAALYMAMSDGQYVFLCNRVPTISRSQQSHANLCTLASMSLCACVLHEHSTIVLKILKQRRTSEAVFNGAYVPKVK